MSADLPPLLEIQDLHVAYGPIRAVRGISLRVPAGQAVCLIGANGAGKSTTLNAISGLLKPARGSIRFDGQEIAGRRPERVVGRGLVQVPEGRLVIAHPDRVGEPGDGRLSASRHRGGAA